VVVLTITVAQQSQHRDTRQIINTAASTITARRAGYGRVLVDGLFPARALADLFAKAFLDEDVRDALRDAWTASGQSDGTVPVAEAVDAQEQFDDAVDRLADLLPRVVVGLEPLDADSLLVALARATSPILPVVDITADVARKWVEV
jgi:hypothetical protein